MYVHLLLLEVITLAIVDLLKEQCPREFRDCSTTEKVMDSISLIDVPISRSHFYCQSVLYQDTE